MDNVSHSYGGDEYALRDINLTWEDGGAYALLGPSGCGKTTMLNIISGLLTPSEGEIYFDGVDISGVSTAERNIAQVFQFPVLYESMTVEQNLRFPLRNRGYSKRDAQDRAGEIIELLDLGDLRGRKARGLSADAKQLVSLGRALVRPDVSAILFDEPLTVIDPGRKWDIRQSLKRIHQELSHTLVYVTHDQTEALTFADEVVVMDVGSVMQQGSPDELFEYPAHRFIGNFIGSPGMNFLPATVSDSTGVDTAGVDTAGTDAAGVDTVALVELPETDVDFAAAAHAGDLLIGIRPEFVRCHDSNGDFRMAAQVERTQDLGTGIQVSLRIGETPLMAKLPANSPLPQDHCWVSFAATYLALFHRDVVVDGATALAEDEGTSP